MRESPRLRRLRSDLKVLEALQADSTILHFEAKGTPPETYLVRFRGNGLAPPDGRGDPRLQTSHAVSIRLGASYPCERPELEWLTPIFHPNISSAGLVCLGGIGKHWVPSLNLDELCEMLWDMVRYKNFDVGSPYNWDAARWAKVQHASRFPLDPRPIRDKLAKVPPPLPPKRPPAPPRPAQQATVVQETRTEQPELQESGIWWLRE
jgi:ubiquitin-protein ligase